jgi:uncharacterized membrane protein
MATKAMQHINRNTQPVADEHINLNWPERYISIAAGVKLSFSGLKKIFKSPFTSFLKLGAGGYLLNRGITGHCAIYYRIGKNTQEPININIRSSFVIDKPRHQVYQFWRKLDNLPLFMNHLDEVEVLDDKRSRWVLKLPMNVAQISWEAEIVQDTTDSMIGWSSLPGSVIDNAGKVRFRDAADGKGTLVDIVITYQPPAGGVGASIAHVLNPVFKNIVDNDVRNFKQYMDLDILTKPKKINGHHKVEEEVKSAKHN